eukprot:m.129474 g.129474  ORF g.129474 m.129474 type:complete len:574 (-) comp15850_c0_seq6:226-1947(-)
MKRLGISITSLLLLSATAYLVVGTEHCTISLTGQSQSVGVGDIFTIGVEACATTAQNYTVQVYLDATLWGSPTTLYMTSPSCSSITMLIPAPVEVGDHQLSVAMHNDSFPTPFRVGLPMLENITCGHVAAPPLSITNSTRRDRVSRAPLVGMEFEPWFTPHNFHWVLAEGAPMVGYYSSFNRRVARLHAYWLWWAGVDYVLVDWTNNLWSKSHWADRGVQAQEIINATTLMFEVYTELRSEGWSTPNIALLPALDNGPSEPIEALQEEVDWITKNYLANYSSILQRFENNPLLVLFDGGVRYTPSSHPVNASEWSIRWMASQLQQGPHAAKNGYWSWMDGVLAPIATPSQCSRAPCTNESITITPAYFTAGGWLATSARGKQQGATFLSQVQTAVESKPQNVLVNQWNEFAGQAEGSKAYADIYNTSLGNDMEPLSLTECGYPRPGTVCGGWGYRYLNLLKAGIMRLGGDDTSSTLMAIASPRNGSRVARSFPLVYTTIGPSPSKVTVTCEGQVVGTSMNSPVMVDVSSLGPDVSNCTLQVVAYGVVTNYLGLLDKMDDAKNAPVAVDLSVLF